MNGIIILDKPGSVTSHDMVLFLRRRFKIKKIGHAGTLDPMATGVLVLLLGDATKLSNNFIADDKEYEGTLTLGIKTDSHDKEGKVISKRDSSGITPDRIRDIFSSFCGEIEQIPPMVSAVKHKGKKLYELARKGIEVERKPRRVKIYNLDIKEIEMPDIIFSVTCSKGTYIRKLADDIGEGLGCGAHLTELRRTRSGNFSINDAITFEDLKQLNKKQLQERLLIHQANHL